MVCAGIAFAIALAGLSSCGAGEPRSAVSAAEFKVLAGAPGPLGSLYRKPGQLLAGGPAAFKRQIAGLKGHPAVVNKWASWCGPCRQEFPFFQKQALKRGRQIAFLGVDGNDAKDSARAFLKKLPVPYPSFFDSNGRIAAVFRGDRVFPTTAFYDSKGELVYTKQGPYVSEVALEKDILRWAS